MDEPCTAAEPSRPLDATVHVVSLNVGLPRLVSWHSRIVSTGIVKAPVAGSVHAAGVGLDGDQQADTELHGGPDKAVYVYPSEHYAAWQKDLDRELTWGMFGENVTVAGVPLENEIAVGDRLRIGSAEFLVTQPRLPCFKLGIRFDDASMVRRFFEAERTGYYLRIVAEGDLEAESQVEMLARDPANVTISAITESVTRDGLDRDHLTRLLSAGALPGGWRSHIERLLQKSDAHA